MSKENPRIAILGFAIECNRFSPVTTAEDFEQDVDIRGNRIVSEARSGKSITMPDLPGFFSEMDRTGDWTPVPLRVALAQPGGPVEENFFKSYLTEIETSLKASLPVDAVFISSHGAALAEGTDDPDGDLFDIVRRIVGPDVPVIVVFDLHANVSRKMIDNINVFVGYLENPHTDIHERGIEAARHMRECLGGARTVIEMVKIPLVPPQIALLTARGPYADLIRYGQTKVGNDILNVSVMAGFAYSDSPKNGLTAVVTARNANRTAAAALSLDIATREGPDAPTPLPWANVIANAEGFGTVISECGSAYTWAVNAHEYRLTPWHNDPVSDSCGEAFYVRDEDSGRYWSPTPLPARPCWSVRCWASPRPISQGPPAYLIDDSGEAPVPPSCPAMVT